MAWLVGATGSWESTRPAAAAAAPVAHPVPWADRLVWEAVVALVAQPAPWAAAVAVVVRWALAEAWAMGGQAATAAALSGLMERPSRGRQAKAPKRRVPGPSACRQATTTWALAVVAVAPAMAARRVATAQRAT
ncbi:hypothetical protein D3C86_1108300 [compost metagenome]